MRIIYENEILKPPETVFPWIEEPEKAMQWQKNVKGGEILVHKPGKVGTIYGWHRTNQYSDSFEVAHLPETAIGRSGGSTAMLGNIQAVFYQAWLDQRPPGAPIVRGVALNALGTKQGPGIQTEYVPIRRHIDPTPISSICVQYAKPVDDLPPALAGL